jgi:pSer/pThr/pTyr-binding forkhead associated (FHA) protein
MSKLSITFKGLPLQTVDLNVGNTGIGRNPANRVHIDSLAIADFHAVLKPVAKGYVLQALQPGFPVLVNDKPVAERLLQDGDHILVGKHSLYYSESRPVTEIEPEQDKKNTAQFRPFEGSFQVMSGKQIGMVIPLKATVTQIGKEASGMVIVTRQEGGYEISVGSPNVRVTINGLSIEEHHGLLADGDIVRVNNSLLQFFQK